MKTKKLALVHTSATLVPIFEDLCSKNMPDVETFNIVDDSLVKSIGTNGGITPDITERVRSYVSSAESGGADTVLVTCSSIGPSVEAAAALSSVPVLRVDQPMADMAVKIGRRIGVVATLATTLVPTADLVKRRAEIAGKEIELAEVLCEGAFEALMNGDAGTHDEKVATALKSLSSKVDVILLAQASMARVVDLLDPDDRKVPILASPSIAIEHLATVMNS